MTNPHSSSLRRDLLLVFLGAALLFTSLLSRDYIGDGVRWLPPMAAREMPPLGGNNHFLSPVVGWGAWQLAVRTGFSSLLAHLTERPVALVFFQGFNALMAATGLVALFLLLRWSRVSRRGAWLGMALTGLSHAYLLHATDMTEPMASMPWMILGAAVVRRAPESRGARWLGGALIGLGAAFYLTALGICVLVGATVGLRYLRRRQWGRGLVAVTEVGASALASLLAIFVAGRLLLAAPRNLNGHEQSLFEIPTGSGLFGHFDPRHLVGAFFGFANAFAPLRDWLGASRLLESSPGVLAYNLAIVALFTAGVVGVGLHVFRFAPALLRSERVADLVGGLLWAACTYGLASYWSATYEKLWLGGVLGTTVFLCVLFEGGEPLERASGEPARSWRHWLALAPLALLLLVSLGAGGVSRRVSPNEDMRVATELSQRLQPPDFAVCAGWDMASVYLAKVVTPSFQCWSLVDEMIASELRADAFTERLRARIAQARAERRRVFFLGLLDVSQEEWHHFNGQRLGLPYSVLEPYREQARVVGKLRGKAGAELTLYQLCDASAPECSGEQVPSWTSNTGP
jgi:hypothetical protein